MSEPKRVYVVMTNDFPSAVFTTEAKAEAYIEKQKISRRTWVAQQYGTPYAELGASINYIHWAIYDFELNRGAIIQAWNGVSESTQ